jgi:hypothetical protein
MADCPPPHESRRKLKLNGRVIHSVIVVVSEYPR